MSVKTLEALGISKAEWERQLREAKKRGDWSIKYQPRAASTHYENKQVTVRLVSGWSFSFDPRMYKQLANASETEIADVRPIGMGFTLEWTTLDQHFGVGPIILDLIGDKYINSEMSRRNGSATSEKKASTSRTNGKLGGRPTKVR